MRILVVGGKGFIGRHLALALEREGHGVVRGGRPGMDFNRDVEPTAWARHLEGIDLVVNAAGLIAESRDQSFDAVHVRGPVALFHACASRGVSVVQISALGADADAATGFHRSKRDADDTLLGLAIPSAVLQPSLVYGEGGASARLFAALASLPLVPLPGDGRQRVQPVHVDDLAEAVARLVGAGQLRRERIAVVGPCGLTLRGFLADLRHAMGGRTARFVRVPMFLVRLAARWGLGLLDRDTLAMLERGTTGDATRFREVLGRWPRAPRAFIPPERAPEVRRLAAVTNVRPLLIASIAFVWLATAAVSAGLYPVADSLQLLARVGLTGKHALVALYGAALLDLVMGIATLALRRRRALWVTQAVLMLGYTAIITFALPEQWLHPYGPVTKNLPMLAALWFLHATEER
ncbi:MAG TPA: SDR family oxidoreductase [Usitatibacter sp.]|nr:SDR family oxidoreductase [Usitatibacter sp.]